MLDPGQTIDRYTVDRVLGQGGMAVVYRVTHDQLGSYHALKASVDFARPGEADPPRIIQTSAVTGEGLDELIGDIRAHAHAADYGGNARREQYFLEKWVRDEYGRYGLELLEEQGGAETLLERGGSFEGAQEAFQAPG